MTSWSILCTGLDIVAVHKVNPTADHVSVHWCPGTRNREATTAEPHQTEVGRKELLHAEERIPLKLELAWSLEQIVNSSGWKQECEVGTKVSRRLDLRAKVRSDKLS